MADQAPDKPKRKRRTKAEMAAARQATIKPPTQGVGVIGINDSAFGSDTSGVRWEALIHIPKFQAFCIERSGLSYENVMDWIVDFCVTELNKDASIFFEEYKKWHDGKGYWKNETIYGELIDEANTN
ncbi:hypothetical protein HADU_04003 [Acinetobacter sp. HA]|uniref:hypothetical protein n=1 Tax=Acinetobacter sp. HA TaxID=1173062 RepID=UPI000263DEB6|nr:hypothetical protein [Acinetobacter sp. HA]EIM39989.1 hypothetical protein HADU_04003 [Acinetobacter sp. HA]